MFHIFWNIVFSLISNQSQRYIINHNNVHAMFSVSSINDRRDQTRPF